MFTLGLRHPIGFGKYVMELLPSASNSFCFYIMKDDLS